MTGVLSFKYIVSVKRVQNAVTGVLSQAHSLSKKSAHFISVISNYETQICRGIKVLYYTPCDTEKYINRNQLLFSHA